MTEVLNYAVQYSQALAQAFPYVLNFGALYATPNNGRYRFTGANTIQIPTILTSGRVDSDRDTISGASRNYSNAWETKVLSNERKWSTLVHPMDIDQTNFVTSIANITQVYNEEQKFPEMDAYLISKIHADWKALGKTGRTTALTVENILAEFDAMMQEMTDKRVPANGRILYVTPAVGTLIKNAKDIVRTANAKDGGTSYNRMVSDIDKVSIVEVPSTLMKTVYDFTVGWKAGAGAKQINMFLVHPIAVITPVSYQFSQLDAPSAKTEGKFIYFEESFEDVFLLNKKADAIQFNLEA